jgi:RHS repeat-associated protein
VDDYDRDGITMVNASMTKMLNRLLSILALAVLCVPTVALAQDEVIYYHTDAIGSVRMVTDAAGAVVARYDYLPFGETWPTSPPNTSPDVRQFGGKEHDANTELDYFGARYYRGVSGRFTTIDPVLNFELALIDPQRWNRYAYALNNPLKFTDPDGRDPRLVGGAIGTAVYSGWNAYVNVSQGRPWYENIGVEASKGFVVGATFGLARAVIGAAELGVLTTTSSTLVGPLGTIATRELDRTFKAGGQSVELFTRLTQSPAVGRSLSAAGGEAGQALASASRQRGTMFAATIPHNVIRMMERAGLVTISRTEMNGAQGLEYKFSAEAMKYLASHFKEVHR